MKTSNTANKITYSLTPEELEILQAFESGKATIKTLSSEESHTHKMAAETTLHQIHEEDAAFQSNPHIQKYTEKRKASPISPKKVLVQDHSNNPFVLK